jgi:ribosome-binding factor A
MKPYPRSRVTGETVREVVASIVLTKITDPRVALVTVTSVEVSADLRHANVYVTAHGDEERYREALRGLESAKGRIRRELGQAVRMKYVPDLHFRIDPSVDEAERIEGVIREEKEREAASQRATQREEPDDE